MIAYTFHITLYDLAFLGTIFIGLMFALLLWYTKKINQAANRLLALALIVVVLWMTRILCIDIRLGTYFPHWSWLPLQFYLAFGPLIYFYVLKITRPEFKFGWKDMLHFIPMLLQQGVSALTFQQTSPVWYLAVSISVITYLYRSFSLIERFYQGLKFNNLRDRHRYELRWLHRLLAGFGLLWLLSIPFTAVLYFYYHYQLGLQAYYPLYLLLAITMIWIAATAFLRPEVDVTRRAPLISKPSPSGALRQKGIWLKKAMEAGLLYQDAELSLSSLGEKLDMHPHDLSRIVNVAFRKNFTDFINEYRIREVTRKMQDPAYNRLTLLGIAFDSGFNSKTTFNRTFREMTGKTPVEYKNEMQKERPSYHLKPYSRSATIISYHEATSGWSPEKLNRSYMFNNYLKIAWRNLVNNRLYSALNILGLAAGMAVTLLIGLWVLNQYSYDRFLPGYAQVYQVEMNLTSQHEGEHTQATIALPLADVLRKEVPGIRYVAVTDAIGLMNHDLLVGDKKLYLGGGASGPEFFKIFQYPFVKGNANLALKDTYSIVLTESTAILLFGNADPMGKYVRYDNSQNLKVTGVIKDIPKNATLQFSYITPFAFKEMTDGWVQDARTRWNYNSFTGYVSLEPGVTYDQIAPKIKYIVFKKSAQMRPLKPELIMHPLKDWHLFTDFKNGKVVGGFVEYVRLFSIIGILVLAIACINFVNLSTARSEKRAREVGVRKAIGSTRKELICQFLTESVLITFLSFLLSLYLAQLVIPSFNSLSGSFVYIPYNNIGFWCMMLIFVLVTGLTAGSRPAFYLSSFSAVKVLKGNILAGRAASLPRKMLLVAQFTCSIALIISTIIVYQQIQYVKSRPTGYSADRLMMTDMSGDLRIKYNALKNELLSSGLVESMASSTAPVTQVSSHFALQKWPGKNAGDEEVNVGGVWVSNEYFKTLRMNFAVGHDFSGDWRNDTLNVIVNEATVRRIGMKNPVNQMISWNGSNKPVRIIGVVEDALMESPYTPVAPVIFGHSPNGYVILYRLPKNADTHTAIQKIGKVFAKYNPAYPYQYKFVNDEFDHKFNLEVLIGKLAGIFAGLAIFISCLGLFGLAAYVAEQRTKEISIRKVLGATVSQVWVLLSWDFILLVIISCFIASPLALYFLRNWLQKYDYHVSIGPGVFVLAAVVALAMTIITVSFQAIRAALANTVKCLRSE